MNLENFSFAHIGSNFIAKELQYNITYFQSPIYNKPIGGLWASPFYNVTGSISDWTDLMLEHSYLMNKFPHENGCLFNISNNSKICNLTTDEEINQIKEQYHMNTINFEELSSYYDAFFIHPWTMSYDLRNKDFQKWKIRTLLINNLDIISNYLPITIYYNEGFYIQDIGELKTISNPSNEYYMLCDFVHQFYKNQLKDSFEEAKIIKLEHEIYQLLLKQIDKKLHPKADNSEILKAILFNEKQKQYQKRKL